MVFIKAFYFYSYDQSEGSPSELGIQSDSEAILNYVFSRNDIDKNYIFTHGRSLGGKFFISAYKVLNYKVQHQSILFIRPIIPYECSFYFI